MLHIALMVALSSPGGVIHRTSHWTDTHAAKSGQVTRRVQNHINWRDTAGVWRASDDTVGLSAGSAPADWQGTYDFERRAIGSGPLQVFVGDSTDAANTALVGIRVSDDPTKTLALKLLNANPVAPDFATARRAVWAGVQQNTALVARYGRGRVSLWLRIAGARPTNFARFLVRQPAGFGFTIHNNSRASFEDAGGVEYFRTAPKYGIEGTLASPAEDKPGAMLVPVSLSEGAPVTVGPKTFRTLVVTWNQAAVDAILAAGKVAWIDPTTTISGTANVEDARILQDQPTFNYGGATGISAGNPNYGGGSESARTNLLVRLATSAIPNGTLTAFRFHATRYNNAYAQTANNLDAYFIQDGNTWVEGTANAANQAGSCDWNHAKDAAQDWLAGHTGCGTSITDYVADANPPTLAYTAYTAGDPYAVSMTLLTAWATAWKLGTRVNNGILLRTRAGTADDMINFASTEWTSNQPYFEIDYVAPKNHRFGRIM